MEEENKWRRVPKEGEGRKERKRESGRRDEVKGRSRGRCRRMKEQMEKERIATKIEGKEEKGG